MRIDLTDSDKRTLTAATGVDDFDPLLSRRPAIEFSLEDRVRNTTAAQWVRPFASGQCPRCPAGDHVTNV